MNAILKILSVFVSMFEKWQREQEVKKHEAEVQEVEDNPSQFFADHFGGVPDDNAPTSNKANTRRDPID